MGIAFESPYFYCHEVCHYITCFASSASSISVYAAIISDNSERRIEVRHGSSSNAYITPSTAASANHSAGVTILSGDSMQGLIQQKQREFEFDAKLSIEESQRVNMNRRTPTYNTTYSTSNNTYNNAASTDFNTWLNSNSYRSQQVANYQRYLSSQVGVQNVPPLSQLLTTARSWDKCGYEPYQLPPQELWSNVVPTLRLYSELKNQEFYRKVVRFVQYIAVRDSMTARAGLMKANT